MVAKHSAADILRSLETKFKVMESLLTPLKFKDRKLRKNSQRIKNAVKQIAIYAGEYDCDGLEANGFWSFIRLIDKFAQLVVASFQKHKHRDYDAKLDPLSTLLVKYLNVIDTLRKASLCASADEHLKNAINSSTSNNNNNNSSGNNNQAAFHVSRKAPNLNCPSFETTISCFRHFLEMRPEQATLHGAFPAFWLCSSAQKAVYGISLISAIFAQLPWSLAAVFDSNYRGRLLTAIQSRATVTYPFAVWNLSDLTLVKKAVTFANRKRDRGISGRTLLVARQQVYKLPKDGGRVICLPANHVKSSDAMESQIRCRLIKDELKANTTNCLVFHCHGGGLMAQSSDSHEVCC